MIYPLQGNLSYQDTKQTVFKPNLVLEGINFAKELDKGEKFSLFHDANRTLYKLTDINEYDTYKQEVLSELFIDLTKYGTTSDDLNNILNKVVHQSRISLTDKPVLEQELTQERHFTQSYGMKQ